MRLLLAFATAADLSPDAPVLGLCPSFSTPPALAAATGPSKLALSRVPATLPCCTVLPGLVLGKRLLVASDNAAPVAYGLAACSDPGVPGPSPGLVAPSPSLLMGR